MGFQPMNGDHRQDADATTSNDNTLVSVIFYATCAHGRIVMLSEAKHLTIEALIAWSIE
jgi:hypothetical protein